MLRIEPAVASLGARPNLGAKRYVVRLGERAEADLEHVAEWYAERHPAGLDRFVLDFTTIRDLPAIFPFAGRSREELSAGVRAYAIHPYAGFYRVVDDRRIVELIRVIPGATHFGRDDFEAG
jgi:plasmid stabilization system protein ParE